MMRRIFFLSIMLLMVSLIFLLAAAEENPRIMLVLDASGSMWGKIQGKTKIEIAREVIADFLKTLEPNVEIGLVVYGHRRKSDCNDIQTLIPIGKATAKQIIDTVNKINPEVKTDIKNSAIAKKKKSFFRHALKKIRRTINRSLADIAHSLSRIRSFTVELAEYLGECCCGCAANTRNRSTCFFCGLISR